MASSQLVLLTCTWVWTHQLEDEKTASGHNFNKEWVCLPKKGPTDNSSWVMDGAWGILSCLILYRSFPGNCTCCTFMNIISTACSKTAPHNSFPSTTFLYPFCLILHVVHQVLSFTMYQPALKIYEHVDFYNYVNIVLKTRIIYGI